MDKQIVVMEEETSKLMLITKDEGALEVVRTLRDTPPAHYTLKIDSFSRLSQMLLDANEQKYESAVFEASGYKWKLCLYPNGDKERNGEGYISMYLVIAETNNLPLGWEVKVDFKLFVFDLIRDQYMSIQDANGKVRHFRSTKTEWGFAQLLPLYIFSDDANGYLVRDTCMFGAEVFVISSTGKGEYLALLEGLDNSTYTWKIDKFSSLVGRVHYSDVFTIKNRKWKLCLYPNGDSTAKDKSLSLFLKLDDLENFPSGLKTYAKFEIRIMNQFHDDQHQELLGTAQFSSASTDSLGRYSFLSLTDLHDNSKGFLVNDTLIIQAQVIAVSGVKNFSEKGSSDSLPQQGTISTPEVARSLRDKTPTRYTLKIEPFSLLSQILLDAKAKNYESDVFEAGGYKWKLSLYPNSDKERNGEGYISLYLVIVETNNLPLGWEVKVDFKLFVFDQIQNTDKSNKDAGIVRHFHRMKTEWGSPQLLPLSIFNDAANGYLVRDTCVFGAELLVMYYTSIRECLTLLQGLGNSTYTWKIDKFSSLAGESHFSDVFTIKNRKWKLRLYPKGDSKAKDKSLSLFLWIDDLGNFPSERIAYAKYKLRIMNQFRGQHAESSDARGFSASCSSGGRSSLLSLSELRDISKGFLVNDTLIVQAEVSVVSAVKNFSG